MFFEKSENIFSGIFQAAQAAKRRAWGGNPNKIPIGQNERLAKFGTVVESCFFYPEFGIRRVIPKSALSRYLRKSLQIQAVLKNISG